MVKNCLFRSYTFLTDDAPYSDIAPPGMTVRSDMEKGAGEAAYRHKTLRLTSPRKAPVMVVCIRDSRSIEYLSVNGNDVDLVHRKRLKPGHYLVLDQVEFGEWIVFNYHGVPPQGIELGLGIRGTDSVEVRIMDISNGIENIPGVPVRPRPGHMMPAPDFLLRDSIIVLKRYTLN
jgi:hypothetical protein